MTALLVASTGGHLRELHRLLPRLGVAEGDRLWVTNDTVQSRSLLAGEEATFVPYQGSRNLPQIVANVGRARAVVKSGRFDVAVSTGSGIALSFLPVAAAAGAGCHYVESCTRVSSPSFTGRLLRWAPGVQCYTQHQRFAGGAWQYGGSVLDGYRPSRREARAIRRLVVTVGTWRQPFRRLIDRMLEIVPQSAEVVWQTGHTDVSDLPIDAVPWLAPEELAAELRRADVVVTHAGMGATLDALDAGKLPVVVPRRQATGEQVDDHQLDLATELDRLGLAVARDASHLTWDALASAAAWRVDQDEHVPPFAFRSPA